MTTVPAAAPAPSAPAASGPAAAPAPAPTPSPVSAPAPASSQTQARAAEMGIPADVAAVFGFDAFKKDEPDLGPAPESSPAAPGASPATPVEPGATPSVPGAPAADLGLPPGAAPTSAPIPGQPSVPELQAQIAQLQGAIHGLMAGQRQPAVGPNGQQVDPNAPPDVELPAYNFAVPDQLISGLRSENPVEHKQAIAALIQGTATNVHRQVVLSMRKEFAAVMPQIITSMLQQHEQSREIFSDFYGKYPALNRPEIRQLVRNVGEQVWREFGMPAYSPQLRDAIAVRAQAILGGAMPAPAMGQPTAVAPAVAPTMVPTGSRPAPMTPVTSMEADIASLL